MTRTSVLFVLLIAPGAAQAQVVVENLAAETLFGFPTSGLRVERENYRVGRLDCVAELVPVQVEERPSTSQNFADILSAAFPTAAGWSYSSAATSLGAGRIEVRTYDVEGTPTRVGAQFAVRYRPQGGDPNATIHWIQVIIDNHNITNNPGHGNAENAVDLAPGVTTPYYDDGLPLAADSGTCLPVCNFLDVTTRVDPASDHDWSAETFLVQGPAPGSGPGAILFLEPGFQWGWRNRCRAPEEPPRDYFALITEATTFVTKGAVEPGAKLEFQATKTGAMTLSKRGIEVPVRLVRANVRVAIERGIDPSGTSRYVVTGGGGAFAPYLFGSDSVGTSTFAIEEGHGYVLWQTGEVSAQMRIRVRAAGFADVVADVTGTGKLDAEARSVVLELSGQALGKGGAAEGRGWISALLVGILVLAAAIVVAWMAYRRRT